ncbi:MAG TPA: hypothetical protein PLY49_02430 [Opitutaceae bacterium]|jgi:hypothetical protein|nr:hypothetical protein [Opitutaceae bacterium]
MNSDQTELPLSAEALELEQHNKAIFEIVEKAAERSSISSELVEHLHEVQRRGLYQADKDENGNPHFKAYNDYTDWLSDELRARLKSYSGHTHIKTRYKMINEAVTVVRLAAQEISPLPTTREQVQEVGKCPLERQGKVWARALEIADGRKVLGRFVRQAAREHGTEIAEPGPSASSVLAQVRSEWRILQPGLLALVDERQLDRINKINDLLLKKAQVNGGFEGGQSEQKQEVQTVTPTMESQPTAPAVTVQQLEPKVVDAPVVERTTTMAFPFVTISDGTVCVGFTNKDEYYRYKGAGFPNLNWRKYSYQDEAKTWRSPGMTSEELEAERTDLRTRLRKAAEKLRTQAA